MAGFTHVELDALAIRNLIAGRAGPVVVQMDMLAKRVQLLARGKVHSETGALAGSIKTEIIIDGLVVVGRIYSDLFYAIFVHEGTGVYAGRGPIRPKRAKMLAFVPKGGSNVVFAKQVKGTPPNPFLVWALQASVTYPVHRTRS
jgi:hypothetical protein